MSFQIFIKKTQICISIEGVPCRKEFSPLRTDPTPEGLHEYEDTVMFPSLKVAEQKKHGSVCSHLTRVVLTEYLLF